MSFFSETDRRDAAFLLPTTRMELCAKALREISAPEEIVMSADWCAEIANLLTDGAENIEIVAHIWRLLGVPSCERLNGRSIFDLIQNILVERDADRLSYKRVLSRCEALEGDKERLLIALEPFINLTDEEVSAGAAPFVRAAREAYETSGGDDA